MLPTNSKLMVDSLTKKQRRLCMSRIRGRNTGPELRLRKALWSHGLRYRVKNRLPGKPDFVFPGIKLAVFVDGCFWHGCPEHYQIPDDNKNFWQNKIKRNIQRDRQVEIQLKNEGWKIIRIWEHDIRKSLDKCVKSLKRIVLKAKPRT